MPGPIVLAIVILLKYLPFDAAGLAFITASNKVLTFSYIFSLPKDFFPTGTCIIAVLSTLYSTLPALISSTAFFTSIVTVPDLGFGINPFGPSTLPNLPAILIISGVATTTSKSNQFSF